MTDEKMEKDVVDADEPEEMQKKKEGDKKSDIWTWSKDFDEKGESDAERIRYAYTCLKRHHDIANDRILTLEEEKNAMMARLHVLEMQRQQWETEKVKQQLMIHQTLTSSNATSNKYLEENQELRQEIQKLREEIEKLR